MLLVLGAALAQDLEAEAPPPDLPPVFSGYELWTEVGDTLGQDLRDFVSDPEGRPLRLWVTGLPANASFDPDTGMLTFSPRDADRGRHVLALHASDGLREGEAPVTIVVTERSWNRAFVPGIGVVATTFREDPETWFAGPVADLDLVAFGNPDGEGPSHGRWYALVGLLPGRGDDVILTYGTGLALSVEGAATRPAILPEFGVEVLGTYRPGEGHVASLAPFGGFWLWNDHHLAVDVRCGYSYALEQVELLSGVRCGSSAHLALW